MDPGECNHKVLCPLINPTTNNKQKVPKIRRNKILKSPTFWIGLVFSLVIIVTIISLVLYSTIYIDEDEKKLTNFSSNSTCSFKGFVSVTNPCVWDSWIKNGAFFQERIFCFAEKNQDMAEIELGIICKSTLFNFALQITSLYSTSPFLNYFFLAAKVYYNSTEGDESAVIRLDFAQPSKFMKYPISIELVDGLLRQDVYDLAKYSCQDLHILKDSLKLTVISK
ncbi:hypothetical protein PRIEUP_LOCUS432, partial [Pristimantis euphronides]